VYFVTRRGKKLIPQRRMHSAKAVWKKSATGGLVGSVEGWNEDVLTVVGRRWLSEGKPLTAGSRIGGEE